LNDFVAGAGRFGETAHVAQIGVHDTLVSLGHGFARLAVYAQAGTVSSVLVPENVAVSVLTYEIVHISAFVEFFADGG